MANNNKNQIKTIFIENNRDYDYRDCRTKKQNDCEIENNKIPYNKNYDHKSISCSQSKAFIAALFLCAIIISGCIIVAYIGPQNGTNLLYASGRRTRVNQRKSDCSCAGQKPFDFIDDDWNMSKPLIPLATNGEIFPWRDIRLPQFLKPIYYNITIHPNLTTFEVKGQVAIQFIVTEDTKFIVLHSHNLTITEQMIEYDNGNTLKISRILEFVAGQQIYIETNEMFQRDQNYILNLRYSSNLSNDFTGFYICNYFDESGEKRYLAATYFQPTYARMAFPCFDEPHLKAKFKMSIFRDRFHISLFNTPVKKTEDVGFYMGTGLLRDDFEETLEMSTYLVAFVICDYVRLTKQTKTGISVSVYTPKSFIKHGDVALETAIFMMDFFETFFEIPYPYSKQDLIAIPEFTNTAMENWGLITYRETAILYNPLDPSTVNLQWITKIIAHEIAHQWFGNLVTMKWWNDVWLNEGFASFLEYMAVNFMKPDWKMMDQFLIDQTQPALVLDALSSTHPISVDDIYSSNQIISIFDIISYKKGAAILQMLSKFLPNDVLHTGMKYFLTKYQYKNAQTDDFWNALNEHVNQTLDIKQIMDVWTKKMGYPLIRLKNEKNVITATQERFLLQISEQEIYEPEIVKTNVLNLTNSTYIGEDNDIKYKWFIPLTFRTNENPSSGIIWMNLTDVVFNITSTAKWIKANVNQSGFYRVLYTDQMWYDLIRDLKNDVNVLSPADKANLIDDAFVLNRAGLLNINITLELLLYLKNEFEYVPWSAALRHLNAWSKSLYESSTYQVFLKFLKNILNPIVDSLNWNSTNNDHVKKLLRSQILSAMVLIAESDKDINEAKNRFHDWMTKNQSIDADLKDVIYSAGVKYGDNTEWNYCWKIFLKTHNPNERQLLLKALGSASDLWLLQRLLLRTLDKEKIRQQDIRLVLTSVAENPTGRLLAWRFLKAHWLQLYSILNNNTLLMGSLTTSITAHLSTPFDYKEVSTYFLGIRMPAASHLLQQSLETIKLNANWLLKNDQGLYDWIKDNLLKQ